MKSSVLSSKIVKKMGALLTGTAIVMGLLAGCSGNSSTGGTTAQPANGTQGIQAQGAASNSGKVLNIYCWNDQFQDRFNELCKDIIPSDVKVNWVITPTTGNAYQDKLDSLLPSNTTANADDRIDLFVVEADYILKYVNSDVTLDLKGDIGLTDADLSNQYAYTQTIATDKAGKLKATSWEANPGIFAYRRSIAKDVLGTDDPTKVQEMLSDWTKFTDVASKMKEKNYKMLSGFDDAYRLFTNTSTAPFVDDKGVLTISESINQWIDLTKEYTDKGYNNKTAIWSPEWSADQSPSGKVFGFFYAPWGVSFTLLGNALQTPVAEGGKAEVGNGIYGDYAICEGPASYYWGGTWICGANGTDNTDLVRDIMKTMTCDTDAMKKLTDKFQDFSNNEVGMKAISDAGYTSDFLGGQNPIPIYLKSAPSIKTDNISPYDQGIAESIGSTMADYFNGTVTKEQAIDNFYKSVLEKYPNLVRP